MMSLARPHDPPPHPLVALASCGCGPTLVSRSWAASKPRRCSRPSLAMARSGAAKSGRRTKKPRSKSQFWSATSTKATRTFPVRGTAARRSRRGPRVRLRADAPVAASNTGIDRTTCARASSSLSAAFGTMVSLTQPTPVPSLAWASVRRSMRPSRRRTLASSACSARGQPAPHLRCGVYTNLFDERDLVLRSAAADAMPCPHAAFVWAAHAFPSALDLWQYSTRRALKQLCGHPARASNVCTRGGSVCGS